jgi:hypothetical protein
MAKKEKVKLYKATKYYFINIRPYQEEVSDVISNQKELLSLPWVKEMTRKGRFKRFSVCEDEGEDENTKYLMIEDDMCDWWWPVAIIPKDFPHTLPLFKEIKKRIPQDD